jgi:hypothetical protein
MRGQLQRIGLLRESGHEHFNGSIVIPVIAPSGEITEVYGRKINDNLRPARRCTCICRGRIAACGTSGAGGFKRNHPVRGPDRCADASGAPGIATSRPLRCRGFYPRSPGGVPVHAASSAC